MPRRDPTVDTFVEELDVVIKRHIDVLNAQPGAIVAHLIHAADALHGRHNVEAEITRVHDEIVFIELGESDGAFFGVGDDPSVLDEIDEEAIGRELVFGSDLG